MEEIFTCDFCLENLEDKAALQEHIKDFHKQPKSIKSESSLTESRQSETSNVIISTFDIKSEFVEDSLDSISFESKKSVRNEVIESNTVILKEEIAEESQDDIQKESSHSFLSEENDWVKADSNPSHLTIKNAIEDEDITGNKNQRRRSVRIDQSDNNQLKRPPPPKEKPYRCDFCHKSYTSMHNLKTHMQRHIEFHKEHECDFCGKRFVYPYNLEQHKNEKHKEYIPEPDPGESNEVNQIKSDIISRRFHFRKALLLEKRMTSKTSVEEPSGEQTDFSPAEFANQYYNQLQSQISGAFDQSNQNDEQTDTDQNSQEIEYDCQELDPEDIEQTESQDFDQFQEESDLIQGPSEEIVIIGENAEHFETPQEDDESAEVSKESLEEAQNSNYEELNSEDVVFENEETDESVMTNYENDSNIKIQAVIKSSIEIGDVLDQPFKCSKCRQTFPDELKRETHENLHFQNIHNCDICQKNFDRLKYLRRHLNRHFSRVTKVKEKRFECEFCPKKFATKYELNNHHNTHTREKKYTCNVCGKAYTQVGSLRQHMKFHTNDLPYECDFCTRRFPTSSRLKTHIEGHVGKKERKHICQFCQGKFVSQSSLRAHERTHTGEKPFKCGFCEKSFAQKGQLQGHERYSK